MKAKECFGIMSFKLISYYLKVFGFYSTDKRNKFYVTYQVFLISAVFGNYIYSFFDNSFEYDFEKITGVASHIESKLIYRFVFSVQ